MLFSETELTASPAKNPFLSCEKCGLYRGCQTPYMKPYGDGEKGVLIIGEAPGASEDRIGRPFVGKSGSALDSALRKMGISLDRDCIRTNACICRPPNNDTPKPKEIAQCRKFLFQVIDDFKPKKIITLGAPALNALIGEREDVKKLASWVGFAIPDQHLKTWIFPTFHPSYVMREEKNGSVRTWWLKHLKAAFDHTSSFYESNYSSECFVIRDPAEAIPIIERMCEADTVAFDYETTGLKPFNKGHKIYTVSISDGMYSWSFRFTRELHDVWRKFLLSPAKKIAHNAKFEEIWSRQILGVSVNNWHWDTMLGAHILDHRPGITSLKRQTYLNFGIAGYEDKIKPYLEAEGGNDFNTIEKAPLNMLLKYGAEDSLYTHLLYNQQRLPIRKRFPEAFDLFMRSMLNFADFEMMGIQAKPGYYDEARETAKGQLERIQTELEKSKHIWKGFSATTPADVATVVYDKLGFVNNEGSRTTAKTFLENLDSPEVKLILEYRKWSTALKTFIKGFRQEISDDGILHCMFNLNTVRSYRSSSSSPNFQNIPKRDDQIRALMRTGLLPYPGQELWEYDFKSVEVCISACYHHDPAMIAYILDPSTDMHRDQACEIFMRSPEEFLSAEGELKKLLKDERYLAKNGFVFPQFYGDYFVNNAKDMWERMSDESKQRIIDLGMRNLADFTMHMEAVENRFWRKKFPVYKEWKEQNWSKFQRRGAIDFYTGFRAASAMSANQANNIAIQGTAFHVLLETMDYVKRRTRRWESNIMGQIHDSMVMSQEPSETEMVHTVFGKALGHVQDLWSDWLVVPLVIESERSPDSWANIKEVGKIMAVA